MMNLLTNRKSGFETSPCSVMVSWVPLSIPEISYVQLPPKGSLGSAMRFTMRQGAVVSTR